MIVAIDIETTGPCPMNDQLLEIYAVRLNEDTLEPEGDDYHIVLRYDGHCENEKVEKMHTENGLLEICATSVATEEVISKDFLDWLHVPPKEVIFLGSSVHFDKKFMEEICGVQFHYRNFDVSSLIRCWDLKILKPHPEMHRAKPDCHNSIYIARCYRQALRAFHE